LSAVSIPPQQFDPLRLQGDGEDAGPAKTGPAKIIIATISAAAARITVKRLIDATPFAESGARQPRRVAQQAKYEGYKDWCNFRKYLSPDVRE
jgi:hypothetical protein